MSTPLPLFLHLLVGCRGHSLFFSTALSSFPFSTPSTLLPTHQSLPPTLLYLPDTHQSIRQASIFSKVYCWKLLWPIKRKTDRTREGFGTVVTCIKFGMWDNMYDTLQTLSHKGIDDKPSESSADYISIDVEPAKKDVAVSAPQILTHKHDVRAEDVVKKLSGYMEDDISSYKNPSPGNKLRFLRTLCKCENWLIEQYCINKFESLGYGEYFMFLEKYMHLLPQALQKCIMGDISENVSLEAHLLPIQLEVLLSQALNSLRENEIVNMRKVSELLARQFPLVCFKLVNGDLMANCPDILREKECNVTSNSVLFSTPLSRLNYFCDSSAQDEKKVEEISGRDNNTATIEGMVAAVTTKDAIEALLKAPMMTDLNLWLHWDILFGPSLGSIVEWLLKEVNTKELLCLITKDGKVIRIDHSATVDSFLKVFIRGSSFETAVQLLSLVALYGGEQNVPLSLLKCHARQAFEVIINNFFEMELQNDKNPLVHGNPSSDQLIVGKSTSGDLHSKLPSNRSILNKAAPVMARFILDCLSYLPIEFCSFAADVLIAGLQSFVNNVPAAILSECKQTEQRLLLHEVGMSLGLMEWVSDYQSFCSSARTGFSPGSSCLDVANSEFNTRSVIGQGELDRRPSSSVGADSAKVSGDGRPANSERLSTLSFHIDNEPARVIESIRQEEFGLDQSLSATENKMLEKQHARLGRALHCLSQELYSQDSHFLLELVQNADDNIYPGNVEPTLTFILQEEGIIVLNNEEGFSANNIRALCDVGNSTKKGHSAGYIGKKGIGFKSVFRVTDAPEIHSNGFHIKFDITEGQIGFVLPTVVPPCNIDLYTRLASADDDRLDQNSWNTCIVLPFRSNLLEGFAMNNILSMFLDLHPSLLLFLHRLQCIKFRNLLDHSLIVMRKEVIGDGIVEVALGNEKMTWFVVSQKLRADVIRSDVQTTEISIAFTLQETSEGGYVPILNQQPVFAFLPLRTYGLKFILQGDFVLPSSREEVDGNSPWNQWLLSEFPDLFVNAEKSFCALPCYRGSVGKAITIFMSFIPLVGEVHGFFSCLPRMIISKLRMSNCLILEGDEIEWVPPCKVLRNWTEQTRSLLPDSLLHEHLGLGFLNKDIVLSDSVAKALGVEDYGPKTLLRVISSLCRSDNGLKSMGLSWLSSWLSAVYVMSSQIFMQTSPSFGTESDFILNLRKTPFIPLSDGKYSSLDEGTIWLHTEAVGQGINDECLLKAFPRLYTKLRIVSPNLLVAAASIESSGSDTTIVENVTRMLYKVGVQRLSVHDIVKVHILPAISDDKNAAGQEELMIEYLAFAMFHLQSSCTTCSLERGGIVAELHEKALILTNYGFKRSYEVPIHFSREFGNPVDVNRLITGLDMRWHEIDTAYMKHSITQSISGGVLKWRNFLQEIGITDFVQVVQVEKSVPDISHANSKDVVRVKDMMSTDLVAKNWESQELFHLLSWLSSKEDAEKSKYLLEILDRLWDDYFSDKVTGYSIGSAGERKPIKSSLITILQDFPWVVSNINNKLHYPKDLFHDCDAVNSVLGVSAPYTIPEVSLVTISPVLFFQIVSKFLGGVVRSERLLADIGLKTQVTLDDALLVLRLWRKSESPFKASLSQMSNFYSFLWKGMAHSKKKILEELHSGPFIFVPNTLSYSEEAVVHGALLSPQEVYWRDNIGTVDQIKSVHPECVPSIASPQTKMLYNYYPNLHDFFVNECGVDESPPFRSYLQILLHLSTTALPHQAAKRVCEVFLMWDDALKSGSLSFEDVEYLKESLLKMEYNVLPSRQDKWVSLHSSFGLICWCDDDNLGKEFRHLGGVDFLYFGESTDEERKMLRAKIVTRESIYYGPADSSFIFSLVNWVLPYAQRYIYNSHPDKYFQLKQSGFENIRHLKIAVVENLFYRNVIKKRKITSQKRHLCNCLLQDNILYCSRESDPHSVFFELSRLLFNGSPDLQFANFLHMITTMAESGATEEQTEFFILNSQKVPKLPAEESSWSLQSMENNNTLLENSLSIKVNEQNSSVVKRKPGINSNWPPVDWKTAPGFNSVTEFGSKKPRASCHLQTREKNIEEPFDVSPTEIDSEINIEVDPTAIAQGTVSLEAEISESQSNVSTNLVSSSTNLVLDSADLVKKNFVMSNCGERDKVSAQQALLTGRLGELVAYKYFVGKVGEVFVNWVNETNETGLPYDIVLGGDENSREYVEVKATKSARKNWFLISMREWQFAVEKGESFSIAHVVLADNNMAKVTIYKNPARLCQLGPYTTNVEPSQPLLKTLFLPQQPFATHTTHTHVALSPSTPATAVQLRRPPPLLHRSHQHRLRISSLTSEPAGIPPPTSYINSWKPSQNPKEAAAQLAFLRLDYARKVKLMRKEYINEMELQRIEKLRKDAARKEALRIANEERKAAKDAKKKAEAIERQAAEEEFRQMLPLKIEPMLLEPSHLMEPNLVSPICHSPPIQEPPCFLRCPFSIDADGNTSYRTKERAEKLEYWRMREKKIEEKKKEKNELLRRQSSLWVDESELDKKVFEAVVDTTPLEHFRLQN
ncbi:hypothetical protein DH2020_043451 [Rehmannia glutinosa]|uniref:Protein NO VEIN C-terminal domain-containing protein n=1 Tax=Rehmannia glutinosa TaxID=99300 RepID=A0ABR0UKI3_REHGL